MPIWVVMWLQSPGVPIFSNSSLSLLRISMILPDIVRMCSCLIYNTHFIKIVCAQKKYITIERKVLRCQERVRRFVHRDSVDSSTFLSPPKLFAI